MSLYLDMFLRALGPSGLHIRGCKGPLDIDLGRITDWTGLVSAFIFVSELGRWSL